MSDAPPDDTVARPPASTLRWALMLAGIVGGFRGLALTVSSLENMFWPVALAAGLLFAGCNLPFCWLSRRLARGRPEARRVAGVGSLLLVVPALLLSPLELERTGAYRQALGQIPYGALLDSLLYGAQLGAAVVHPLLLAWIAFAARRSAGRERSGPASVTTASSEPSGLINAWMLVVGIVLGYLWALGGWFVCDALGLRGAKRGTLFGGSVGANDTTVGLFVMFASGAALLCAHAVYRWRGWGLTAGALIGLGLCFAAVTS